MAAGGSVSGSLGFTCRIVMWCSFSDASCAMSESMQSSLHRKMSSLVELRTTLYAAPGPAQAGSPFSPAVVVCLWLVGGGLVQPSLTYHENCWYIINADPSAFPSSSACGCCGGRCHQWRRRCHWRRWVSSATGGRSSSSDVARRGGLRWNYSPPPFSWPSGSARDVGILREYLPQLS